MSQRSNNDVNDVQYEKLHYDKHIEFFKWMIGIAGGALSVMVAVATCTTYSSVKDYRDDLKSSMNEIKNDIKDIKTESITTIKDTRKDVDNQIDNLNSQVEEQIPLITENAENLALTAVRRSINEQFEANNIRELISKTADDKLKNQVGEILEGKINDATKGIELQTKAVATLSVAIDQIRAGEKSWFDTVKNMSKNHELPIIRELSSTLLKRKISDYKNAQPYLFVQPTDTVIFLSFQTLDNQKPQTKSVDEAVKAIVDFINTNQNLDELSMMFQNLNNVTNKSFELFDFEGVNQWSKKRAIGFIQPPNRPPSKRKTP